MNGESGCFGTLKIEIPMTTTINRRTTLLDTAALPAALAPRGLAKAASTPNAMDVRHVRSYRQRQTPLRRCLPSRPSTLPTSPGSPCT